VLVRIANVVEDDRPLLAEGMFVRALLPVGKPRPALLVPKDALVLGGPQPLVYVVAGDGRTVQPVLVEMAGAVDGRVAVRGSLAAGQRVVVRGNERLRPGAPVRDLGDPPAASAASSGN
jgi:multidrug efflux pump subunit AcrA (membrane-fusion protein)